MSDEHIRSRAEDLPMPEFEHTAITTAPEKLVKPQPIPSSSIRS